MSFFADYKQEREGKLTIETKDGFAIYSFQKDVCYIEDIYVTPAMRKNHAAKEMADWITRIAKERGCRKLMGSVAPSTNGSNESLKVLQAYGMRLHSAQYDMVFFVKDI